MYISLLIIQDIETALRRAKNPRTTSCLRVAARLLEYAAMELRVAADANEPGKQVTNRSRAQGPQHGGSGNAERGTQKTNKRKAL